MVSLDARAESDLRTAIHSLQTVLPKDARAAIEQTSFPQFENPKAVDKNAAELENAIDKLIELRSQQKLDPQGRIRVKEYLRKWYRASYPFARTFITATSGASAVLFSQG